MKYLLSNKKMKDFHKLKSKNYYNNNKLNNYYSNKKMKDLHKLKSKNYYNNNKLNNYYGNNKNNHHYNLLNIMN
jgi:hypothetical protein